MFRRRRLRFKRRSRYRRYGRRSRRPIRRRRLRRWKNTKPNMKSRFYNKTFIYTTAIQPGQDGVYAFERNWSEIISGTDFGSFTSLFNAFTIKKYQVRFSRSQHVGKYSNDGTGAVKFDVVGAQGYEGYFASTWQGDFPAPLPLTYTAFETQRQDLMERYSFSQFNNANTFTRSFYPFKVCKKTKNIVTWYPMPTTLPFAMNGGFMYRLFFKLDTASGTLPPGPTAGYPILGEIEIRVNVSFMNSK